MNSFNSVRKRFISLEISTFSYSDFLKELVLLGMDNCSSYICVANVHMLIEASIDENFRNIVNSANLVSPDGIPLSKGIEYLYGLKQERIAGMDILPDLLKISENENISVFFYGGTDQMLKNTYDFCLSKFPNLNIGGLISPPFRELTFDEEIQYINQINESGAGFVFVALGCPKQEKWMASMKGRINACMIGIGGALPVMIGMQKRAPKWMQNSGLEWMYRLFQEPRRLFGRYFKTNTIFIFLFIKEFLKVRVLKKA